MANGCPVVVDGVLAVEVLAVVLKGDEVFVMKDEHAGERDYVPTYPQKEQAQRKKLVIVDKEVLHPLFFVVEQCGEGDSYCVGAREQVEHRLNRSLFLQARRAKDFAHVLQTQ